MKYLHGTKENMALESKLTSDLHLLIFCCPTEHWSPLTISRVTETLLALNTPQMIDKVYPILSEYDTQHDRLSQYWRPAVQSILKQIDDLDKLGISSHVGTLIKSILCLTIPDCNARVQQVILRVLCGDSGSSMIKLLDVFPDQTLVHDYDKYYVYIFLFAVRDSKSRIH